MEILQKPEVEVSKISVRGIGCKPKGSAIPTKLCIILGKANGTKSGVNKVTGDEWSALTGDFLAIVTQEDVTAYGDRIRAGKLFLPSGIQDRVEAMVKEAKGEVVKMAIEIRSKEAKNPIGYTYEAVNLIPLEVVSDPLSDLIASVNLPVNVQKQPPATPTTPAAGPETNGKKK